MFEHPDDQDIEDTFIQLARRLPGDAYLNVREHFDQEHDLTTQEGLLQSFYCISRIMLFMMDGLNSVNIGLVRIMAGDDIFHPPEPPKEE